MIYDISLWDWYFLVIEYAPEDAKIAETAFLKLCENVLCRA